jgi:hypothetical protein
MVAAVMMMIMMMYILEARYAAYIFNNLEHSLLSAGPIPFISPRQFPTLAKFCHAQVQWLFSTYTEHL